MGGGCMGGLTLWMDADGEEWVQMRGGGGEGGGERPALVSDYWIL